MHRLILIALALILGGCASLAYYGQAIGGHLSLLGRTRPIEELLSDPALAPELKQRLERVLVIRAFATEALSLPDNGSYRRYADLERPFAVWNVFAAPELSLTAKEWCFLFAGCVAYRGYFVQTDAEREAVRLRTEDYDVHVGGVIAYSTLGWFDDPLLNTMLARPEPELAGLLFHELAHQKIYVRDDTAFNESFAMTVEREGVRRWLAAQIAQADYPTYTERAGRREEFIALVLRTRTQLEALYASAVNDHDKRTGKRELLDALRRDYTALKKRWGGHADFDGWMENLNNAKLLSIGLYHNHIAAFEVLLARHHGNLAAFYRTVQELAQQPRAARDAALATLSAKPPGSSAPSRVGTQRRGTIVRAGA